MNWDDLLWLLILLLPALAQLLSRKPRKETPSPSFPPEPEPETPPPPPLWQEEAFERGTPPPPSRKPPAPAEKPRRRRPRPARHPDLRQAMIWYEILGPPVSRRGPDRLPYED